jgi:hypothetical protein
MVRRGWLKSKRLWIGIAACLLVVAVIWVCIPKPGITRQNYRKIQIGMTVGEVTALMGRPSGNFASPSAIIVVPDSETFGEFRSGGEQPFWVSNSGYVTISLDENNRVGGAAFTNVRDDSVMGRIGRVFGW